MSCETQIAQLGSNKKRDAHRTQVAAPLLIFGHEQAEIRALVALALEFHIAEQPIRWVCQSCNAVAFIQQHVDEGFLVCGWGHRVSCWNEWRRKGFWEWCIARSKDNGTRALQM